jgi:hypothetical protein
MRLPFGHRAPRTTFLSIASAVMLLFPIWAVANGGATHPVMVHPALEKLPQVLILQLVSFVFSPGIVTAGTQTQATIQVSGGSTPYHAWLNNSPSGCQPPTVPVVSSNTTNVFNCRPITPGNYNVHLDIVDSSSPPARASGSAPLTVNGNGNGNGGSNSSSKSNGSGLFNFPSGLFGLLTIFVFVFLGAIVALAVGVIAMAVSPSRRLRQLNDTLAAQPKPPVRGGPPP